ncbi:LmbE-like protein [Daedalea quercina L-15889]|uniref:N-acetylglucosaminylphosphatidylinositol deacetylase n=1 Tax=Daedalea quercina L-15889 TaxID=1314783 RepID=A0A165QV87_9APHY|nr:LmbE-like protein [Daedalea quercina L-15889]
MPTIPTLSLVVLIFSLLFTLFSRPSCQAIEVLTQPATEDDSRILLLTAHPDDECMFFAPTLLGLLAQSTASSESPKIPEVFSLCLSVGNADGLGNVRRDELGRSLDVLGVPSSRRWVVDRSDLQDNFTAQWDYGTIAEVVRPYVVENRITAILTFDGYGISGHPNHVSLPQGVVRMLSAFPSSIDGNTGASLQPRLFTLVSVPLLQKYTGPAASIQSKTASAASTALRTLRGRLARAEAPTIFPAKSSEDGRTRSSVGKRDSEGGARPGPVFVAGMREYVMALRAMMQHRSQLVWFRWLYVTFSRYMWVNDWVEVVPPSSTHSAASV